MTKQFAVTVGEKEFELVNRMIGALKFNGINKNRAVFLGELIRKECKSNKLFKELNCDA